MLAPITVSPLAFLVILFIFASVGLVYFVSKNRSNVNNLNLRLNKADLVILCLLDVIYILLLYVRSTTTGNGLFAFKILALGYVPKIPTGWDVMWYISTSKYLAYLLSMGDFNKVVTIMFNSDRPTYFLLTTSLALLVGAERAVILTFFITIVVYISSSYIIALNLTGSRVLAIMISLLPFFGYPFLRMAEDLYASLLYNALFLMLFLAIAYRKWVIGSILLLMLLFMFTWLTLLIVVALLSLEYFIKFRRGVKLTIATVLLGILLISLTKYIKELTDSLSFGYASDALLVGSAILFLALAILTKSLNGLKLRLVYYGSVVSMISLTFPLFYFLVASSSELLPSSLVRDFPSQALFWIPWHLYIGSIVEVSNIPHGKLKIAFKLGKNVWGFPKKINFVTLFVILGVMVHSFIYYQNNLVFHETVPDTGLLQRLEWVARKYGYANQTIVIAYTSSGIWHNELNWIGYLTGASVYPLTNINDWLNANETNQPIENKALLNFYRKVGIDIYRNTTLILIKGLVDTIPSMAMSTDYEGIYIITRE